MLTWYRLLLRLYPRVFRDRFGPQMAAAFAELAAERRFSGGRAALIGLWLQTVADVARNGLAERRRHRATASRSLDGLAADFRFAWRSIAARPAVAVFIVLTLTVGTGASTAIFSVVDAVVLQPLPYPNDRQLVTVTERQPSNPATGVSWPAFTDWHALPALAGFAAVVPQSATFRGASEPERVDGVMVSPTFFDVVGIRPILGQSFAADRPLFDPDRKVMLSHALWTRHFGGDPSVIGRRVTLDGHPFTIVGVMPQSFSYPAGNEFWATLDPEMSMTKDLRSVRFLHTIGRLAEGASLTRLQAQLDEVAQRRAPELPAAERNWTPIAQSLREQTIGAVRRPLALVLGAVLLLTVVGCCNAAAMLLARGAVRSREIAVRAAVGASRGRIVRQLLLESLIIAATAGALGTLFASSMFDTITTLSLGQVPRIETLAISPRIVAFVVLFTGIVVALFGIAPAIVISGIRPAEAIGSARSTGGGPRKSRGLRALVVAECAVALVILAGGGLLVNSFLRLSRVETGIDPSNVLTAKVSVPVTPAWRGDPPRRRLHADLLERVSTLPDVRAAAVVSRLPLSEIRGGSPVGTPEQPAKLPRVTANVVSDDYFRAVGARVLSGRAFSANDIDRAPQVAVVNQALAAALWPGEEPVGKTIVYRHYRGPVTLAVVGMVAPIRYDGLTSEYKPELFVSYRQSAVVPLQLVVRASEDPMDSVPAIRAQLRQADPTAAVTLDGVSTLERQLASAAARPRFFAALLGAFGLAALLLCALGLHGVLSFWAEERRQEFGVRIALGATRRELYRQVVGQGATLAAVGTIIGLGIAAAASRVLAGLLFGITAVDISTYAVVSVLLLLAAIAACLPAARRAASVDAVQMLRGH